ncbi:MAG: hypothetical protein ACTIC2_02320 [Enterococcus devriesei]|uniref:hypothetical protein n=1 Tax=Enterococcus devriesei TaxID=319970 RepID=UPI003F933CD5
MYTLRRIIVLLLLTLSFIALVIDPVITCANSEETEIMITFIEDKGSNTGHIQDIVAPYQDQHNSGESDKNDARIIDYKFQSAKIYPRTGEKPLLSILLQLVGMLILLLFFLLLVLKKQSRIYTSRENKYEVKDIKEG